MAPAATPSTASTLLQQQIENPERRGLRRADRCRRPGRAQPGASPARTRIRQSARRVASSSSRCTAEERRAEADAAGIVVVDEDARPAPCSAPGSRWCHRCRSRCRRRGDRTSAAAAPTCRIANDRPTTPSRRSSAAHGSTPITARRNRQPVGRRVHLLLGQIELARADVLVRVELDLLEADDARHDVDLAVR